MWSIMTRHHVYDLHIVFESAKKCVGLLSCHCQWDTGYVTGGLNNLNITLQEQCYTMVSWKAKRPYLLNLQVSRYYILPLRAVCVWSRHGEQTIQISNKLAISAYYVTPLYTEVGTYCFTSVRSVCLSLCKDTIHFSPAFSIVQAV